MTNDERRQLAVEVTKRLADAGKVIEGGWCGLAIILELPNPPSIQREEMRKAFFAGAQHLFSAIMSVLDPGTEPTEKDLARMDKIHNELEAFSKEMMASLEKK
jgi:hypothetical protein